MIGYITFQSVLLLNKIPKRFVTSTFRHLKKGKLFDEKWQELLYELTGRSVKEFVEACKKATGANIKVDYLPRRPGDYAEVYSDPSKILRELNWSAKYIDLEKSLQVAWKWQKAHRNGYGSSPASI